MIHETTLSKRRLPIVLVLVVLVGGFLTYKMAQHHHTQKLVTQQDVTKKLVSEALQPCADAQKKDPLHFHFTDYIPCYQHALRIDPGSTSLKSHLADELTWAGRFTEAAQLYQQVARVPGPFQVPAQKALQPGVMKKMMLSAASSQQMLSDLQTMTAKHQAQERAFLSQHAVMQGGRIDSMAEPFKTEWLQMRSQHARDEQELSSRL